MAKRKKATGKPAGQRVKIKPADKKSQTKAGASKARPGKPAKSVGAAGKATRTNGRAGGRPKKTAKRKPGAVPAPAVAAKKKKAAPGSKASGARSPSAKRPIEQYGHADKQRANNPPVGLVNAATDPVEPAKKTYQYDPHLDPQLVWAGKAERTSFEVPSVSLHVHERIDPKTIIAAVRTNGDRMTDSKPRPGRQMSLFEATDENPPLRDALDFYKHPHGWTNRLVAGDSLLVMNSLLEKEGMAGKVQMVFPDPPYGIRYGSNFQPFVNNRDVKDGKDSDLTREPEMIRAFRDTWEVGVHSYLTALRDRVLFARELLSESGSIFLQIGDANVHLVRNVLDEIFGAAGCCSLISYVKTSTTTGRLLPGTCDYLLWYAKNPAHVKYRQLFAPKDLGETGAGSYTQLQLADGTRRPMTHAERSNSDLLPNNARAYRIDNLTSPRVREGRTGYFEIEFNGKSILPRKGEWKTNREGIERLKLADRIATTGTGLYYVRFIDDFPAYPYNNNWTDTITAGFASDKRYVVETNAKVVQRCIAMTTDPGDLVLDPTCGSGTTAYAAESTGRRWITCDTSRVAITLTKQRLMTSVFDYYELAHKTEGVGGGFKYKTVPHVTLKSIANNREIREGMTRAEVDAAIAKNADPEVLYDRPLPDKSKVRVTGPFTVEAVPAINVRPLEEVTISRPLILEPQGTLPGMPEAAQPQLKMTADTSISRYGETARQRQWRDELQAAGVRGKGGQKLLIARLEPCPAARWLHALGETKDIPPKPVAVSFGPEFAPLEQRQVEEALSEAQQLHPRPQILLFAAFQFDPEAAKDIDEINPKLARVTPLRVQMNTDLLTDDLKRKRASNESFWLMGQPDAELRRVKGEAGDELWQIELLGFDYYNPVTGEIESGDTSRVAMWLLDPDYDGRSLFPRQVFFPMAGDKDGWARLAKNLKAEIDEELIEAYRGTESLPFAAGRHKRAAVKIVDDRGIESLKIVPLGEGAGQ